MTFLLLLKFLSAFIEFGTCVSLDSVFYKGKRNAQNETQFIMINSDCPNWIIRNATGNAWSLFTPINDPIQSTCLKAIEQSVESIDRIQTLDLSKLKFTEQSLDILESLLKDKTFKSITVYPFLFPFITEQNTERFFSILGQAKQIESLIILTRETLPTSESIRLFAQSSRTKHLTVSKDMLGLLISHASLFKHLESISLSGGSFHSAPVITSTMINKFPKLNTFNSPIYFDQIMKTRDSINGASMSQLNRFTPTKKFKSLKVDMDINNQQNIMNMLMNSKDSLKSLFLSPNQQTYVLNHTFFKTNVIDNLSLSYKTKCVSIDFNNTLFNLKSFEYYYGYYVGHYHQISHFGPFEQVLEFVKTQEGLTSLSYRFDYIGKRFPYNEFLVFYQCVCELMREKVNIKYLHLSLPVELNTDFVAQFVEMTRLVGRLDFMINSIGADVVVDQINENEIPEDLLQ